MVGISGRSSIGCVEAQTARGKGLTDSRVRMETVWPASGVQTLRVIVYQVLSLALAPGDAQLRVRGSAQECVAHLLCD